jgi:hypothetical protein
MLGSADLDCATLAVNSEDSTKRFWHLLLSYFTFEACVVGVYFSSIGTLVLVRHSTYQIIMDPLS